MRLRSKRGDPEPPFCSLNWVITFLCKPVPNGRSAHLAAGGLLCPRALGYGGCGYQVRRTPSAPREAALTGTLVVGYVDRVEGDSSGMDPADHPGFAESLRFGIDVAVIGGVAGVFAGQRIKVFVRAFGD